MHGIYNVHLYMQFGYTRLYAYVIHTLDLNSGEQTHFKIS